MAEAEQPERLAHDRQVTVDDVRQLMGASTPHFALQLRNRIRKLIRGAPRRGPRPPARRAGDRAARADRLHGRDARRAGAARPARRCGRSTTTTSRATSGPDHRVSLSAGLERAIGLLDPARRPARAAVPDGYLDLLGGAGRRGGRPAQRLMLTRGLPVVYERWWRPAWGRVLMGPLGPGTAGERRIAARAARARPGRHRARHRVRAGQLRARRSPGTVGPRGLVVGLDASQTMLARAVAGHARGAEHRLHPRRRDPAAVQGRRVRRDLLLRRAAPVRRAAGRARRDGARARAGRAARDPDQRPRAAHPGAGRRAGRRRDRPAGVRPRRDHRGAGGARLRRSPAARSPGSPSSWGAKGRPLAA